MKEMRAVGARDRHQSATWKQTVAQVGKVHERY